MSLNFTQLTAFAVVAVAGSVGAGARKLMVSQPAVSKQIGELEKAVGVKLFERNTKGVRLTEAGKLLDEYTRQIFALAVEAEQALDDMQGLRRGSLSIGATSTLGVHFLPPLLVRFQRKFPGIQLKVEIDSARVLQERLAEGGLDMAMSEVRMQSPKILITEFMRERFVAIAAPKHAIARRRSVSMRELSREPFIVRNAGDEGGSLVERSFAAKGFRISPVLSLSSTEAIKHAVAVGLGVAMISSLAAAGDLAAKRLKEIRVRGFSIERAIYHCVLRTKRESKSAHAFTCLVRHAAAGRLPKLR